MIKKEDIIPIPGECSNTRVEAFSMMAYVKEKGLRSIVVTAAPFHQLRAFMTAVTAAFELYPEVILYSLSGCPLPWDKEVLHSQGTLSGDRNELMIGELRRIETYSQKGDLAEPLQVLGYLDDRDKRKDSMFVEA